MTERSPEPKPNDEPERPGPFDHASWSYEDDNGPDAVYFRSLMEAAVRGEELVRNLHTRLAIDSIGQMSEREYSAYWHYVLGAYDFGWDPVAYYNALVDDDAHDSKYAKDLRAKLGWDYVEPVGPDLPSTSPEDPAQA